MPKKAGVIPAMVWILVFSLMTIFVYCCYTLCVIRSAIFIFTPRLLTWTNAGWFVSDAYCTFGNWQSSTIYEMFMLQRDAKKKKHIQTLWELCIHFTSFSPGISLPNMYPWSAFCLSFTLYYSSNFTHYIYLFLFVFFPVFPQTSMVTSPKILFRMLFPSFFQENSTTTHVSRSPKITWVSKNAKNATERGPLGFGPIEFLMDTGIIKYVYWWKNCNFDVPSQLKTFKFWWVHSEIFQALHERFDRYFKCIAFTGHDLDGDPVIVERSPCWGQKVGFHGTLVGPWDERYIYY